MDKLVRKISNAMALIGGTVLAGLILITCLSVIGRALNTIGHMDFVETNLGPISSILTAFGPINGDFEIVEAGVAFAIMAFIPLCQLNREHATVEIITSLLPGSTNRILGFVWEVLFAFVLLVIAWRLYAGTMDKIRYGETTFMLQFPIWWGYAACTFAACVACAVALYCVFSRFSELKSQPQSTGGYVE